MKRAHEFTTVPIEQALDDFEHARMCAFKPEEWERKALEHRLRAGEIIRPLPGLYARRAYWDGLSREEKLLHAVKTEGILHPTWVFTHATAAFAHGLEASRSLLWPIHYTTTRSGDGRAAPHHVHHRREDISFVRVDGIKVTDPAQTVVDCARTLPFGEALAVADSALHLKKVTRTDLAGLLGAQPGRRGNAQARRVVELADPRPESGGESLVRALMIELGLPAPELQAEIPDAEAPGRMYRVDFLFRPPDASPVILELDGLEKYQNAEMTGGRSAVQVMARERQREAALTAHGNRVARIGFAQAMDPVFLLDRLAVYGIEPVGMT